MNCEFCDNPFKMKEYLLNKCKLHFCSSKCYGLWQRGKSSNERAGRPNIKQRVIKKCEGCDIEMILTPYEFHVKKFCSHKCFWNYNQGENNSSYRGFSSRYRGPNWETQRKLQLMNDSYRCFLCKSENELNVHHIEPFALFDDYEDANQLENLITLCNKCHGEVETQYNKLYPDINNRKIPNIKPHPIDCKLCNTPFSPLSHAGKICNSCKTFNCEICDKEFISDKISKNRIPRFCSKECSIIDKQSNAKWPRKCQTCGIKIKPNRLYCRPCFITEVRTKVKPHMIEKMQELRKLGLTYKLIGKELGLCVDTVITYLKKTSIH